MKNVSLSMIGVLGLSAIYAYLFAFKGTRRELMKKQIDELELLLHNITGRRDRETILARCEILSLRLLNEISEDLHEMAAHRREYQSALNDIRKDIGSLTGSIQESKDGKELLRLLRKMAGETELAPETDPSRWSLDAYEWTLHDGERARLVWRWNDEERQWSIHLQSEPAVSFVTSTTSAGALIGRASEALRSLISARNAEGGP